MNKLLKVILSIVITFIAAAIGSLATVNSLSTWYTELAKPFFNPPNWIFGPVWTALYILMAIAVYVVWAKETDRMALGMYGVQLLFNVCWSVFFFGLQNPVLAFVCIIVLWAAILYTIILFYRIQPVAAYLLIPYLLWVTFAAILNGAIVILN